jgi:hypothetical protein
VAPASEGATHWRPVFLFSETDPVEVTTPLGGGTKVYMDCKFVPDNGKRVSGGYLDGDQPGGRWEGIPHASPSIYGPPLVVGTEVLRPINVTVADTSFKPAVIVGGGGSAALPIDHVETYGDPDVAGAGAALSDDDQDTYVVIDSSEDATWFIHLDGAWLVGASEFTLYVATTTISHGVNPATIRVTLSNEVGGDYQITGILPLSDTSDFQQITVDPWFFANPGVGLWTWTYLGSGSAPATYEELRDGLGTAPVVKVEGYDGNPYVVNLSQVEIETSTPPGVALSDDNDATYAEQWRSVRPDPPVNEAPVMIATFAPVEAAAAEMVDFWLRFQTLNDAGAVHSFFVLGIFSQGDQVGLLARDPAAISAIHVPEQNTLYDWNGGWLFAPVGAKSLPQALLDGFEVWVLRLDMGQGIGDFGIRVHEMGMTVNTYS